MALVPLSTEFHLKVGRLGASVALLTVGVLVRARRWAGSARTYEGPPEACRPVPVRPCADVVGAPRGPVAAAEAELRTRVSELASDLASRIGSESQGSTGGPAHP
ncbi:hypothetical protein EOT10_03410 [Streptomyces antnestii]|uniref:Uncharacterized protein n=1 Tax=Streptomyces antnestii TaxID=2494256 RepID=A0A3S2VJI3_9ACTN|nr:hypothetical protein [Streptomyces sp. San01]RVU28915.1 hypothetical protein EOT10_03410 [Streptomyces sp. San01]